MSTERDRNGNATSGDTGSKANEPHEERSPETEEDPSNDLLREAIDMISRLSKYPVRTDR